MTHPYWTIAVLATLVFGWLLVACVINESDGYTDLTLMGIALAVISAPIAGALWPLSALVLGIWALAKEAPERRAQRQREARSKPPAPETDEQRYHRLVREQRNLAAQARRDGQPELADMHDLLAAQNEQLAAVYAPKEPA